MVQHRDGGDKVKTLGKRVGHHVTVDESDTSVWRASGASARDDVTIHVNRGDVVAQPCKPAGKQACAAPDIKGTRTIEGNRTQYQVVVMNVVIPSRRAHRSSIVPRLLGRPLG